MIQSIAKDSDYARKSQALLINISAAKSIAKILKTNLGPRGTLKMLVSGSGEIRLTKDGCVLLSDMHIQHPTAALIARAATAQDDITGDGTTSIVLLVGEILSISERYLNEGSHATTLVDGILLAKKEARLYLNYLGKMMKEKHVKTIGRDVLLNVAKTSVRTKLSGKLADKLANIIVDAIEIVRQKGKEIDLHMVERMHMQHKMSMDTELIKGIVMDHGPRHPLMRRDLSNCFILTMNVELEYTKSEVKARWNFKNAKKRREFTEAERKVVDDKVLKIIELKKLVCGDDKEKNFVVINQRGIDPLSLEMLAKNGITALRRAKRRNMERIPLACGGAPANSLEDLSPKILGWAKRVHEIILGEQKYTFLEVGDNHKSGPLKSCTVLFKGPNKHTIAQIQDATRDGLRAVKNCIDSDTVLPGGGGVEVLLSEHLMEYAKKVKKGKLTLGIKCFAEALLCIPKTLAQNSGLDTQESLINMINAAREKKIPALDIFTGKTIDPIRNGIFDNLIVKEQMIETATYTATQLLFVDEILKAGRNRKSGRKL